jgi:cytochrome c oxidase subunit 1
MSVADRYDPLIDPDENEARNLHETWRSHPGLIGWLAEVDHKKIANRYIFTAFFFFVLGGLEAFVMRLQLARPENHLVGPDLYNQIFTMHGSTMMFLFAVPVMEAVGVLIVPLMIGTRNMAFPRLNAYSYYVYLIGGLLLYAGFIFNTGPDAGWFSYVPLAGPQYSPGKRVDVWAQMITFTELAGLAVAVNQIATIFKFRAPGMSLSRMPLFVWAILVQSFMVVFAMPAVMVASSLLAMDRLVATQFFNPAEGGDALLWQHMFWFFGHPEVYIIFIPALGMVSAIIATFTRRPVFGYLPMVLSLVATGFIGFGLWVHHMFTTGLPQLGQSFFTAASMMIAIPSGVQIFCWIATLWSGRPRLQTPLLFVLGFFFIFVAGGLTGVMLASVPLDLQVHDTFFVVAHFHYVLIGGAVFPLLGAMFYWFPKITGRMPSERLGKWSFWISFLGFNLTFFPMHQLGFQGMPRRIYTYRAETGWGDLNLLATLGASLMAAGLLIYLINAIVSYRRGALAPEDPWGGESLEWATTSPPPSYNFLHPPTVRGRSQMWEQGPDQPVIVGLRDDRREVLVTRLLDAEPDHRDVLPGPSLWPLLVALATGVTFIGVIFNPWAIPVGLILLAITLIGWFWPRGDMDREKLEEQP